MLAVALHGDDLASGFCSADEFVIAKPDAGRAHRICRLTIRDEVCSRRLEHLSGAGVHVLLCGAFERSLASDAEALGIRVISGLTGKADRLIESFARNETERHRSASGRSKRSGSGRRESSIHEEDGACQRNG